jgi:hypothetical protein
VNRVIVDTTTGTVLDLRACYIVDADALTQQEQLTLEWGSDHQIANLAFERGQSVMATIANAIAL